MRFFKLLTQHPTTNDWPRAFSITSLLEWLRLDQWYLLLNWSFSLFLSLRSTTDTSKTTPYKWKENDSTWTGSTTQLKFHPPFPGINPTVLLQPNVREQTFRSNNVHLFETTVSLGVVKHYPVNALQLIHILLTGKPSYHCSTIRECAVVFLTSASYSGEGPDGFIGTEGALGIDSPAQRFPTHPPIH